MFLEMKIAGLTLDPTTNMPIIILKDLNGNNALPIWIGIAEASAIATKLENVDLARPMTHDLMRNILVKLEVTLEKIEVTDLRDNTFYANIYLRVGNRVVPIDSRPSDAIALATHYDPHLPIYVDEEVIEAAT
jgi:bifunctional DNase/RNase